MTAHYTVVLGFPPGKELAVGRHTPCSEIHICPPGSAGQSQADGLQTDNRRNTLPDIVYLVGRQSDGPAEGKSLAPDLHRGIIQFGSGRNHCHKQDHHIGTGQSGSSAPRPHCAGAGININVQDVSRFGRILKCHDEVKESRLLGHGKRLGCKGGCARKMTVFLYSLGRRGGNSRSRVLGGIIRHRSHSVGRALEICLQFQVRSR